MDRFLFFIVGTILGLFGGFSISNFFNSRQINQDNQLNFTMLESVFEQYIDELSKKQEEIKSQLLKWKLELDETYKNLAKNKVGNTKFSKSELVIDLMEEGYKAEEIAKKLGIGKGEVELIFQLKNNEHPN